jgi:pentose-5-phosphate-3-epimerase
MGTYDSTGVSFSPNTSVDLTKSLLSEVNRIRVMRIPDKRKILSVIRFIIDKMLPLKIHKKFESIDPQSTNTIGCGLCSLRSLYQALKYPKNTSTPIDLDLSVEAQRVMFTDFIQSIIDQVDIEHDDIRRELLNVIDWVNKEWVHYSLNKDTLMDIPRYPTDKWFDLVDLLPVLNSSIFHIPMIYTMYMSKSGYYSPLQR